jgi:nucleotide-binding universal stress UspA family protein
MIKRILAGVCDPQYTVAISHYACELAQRFNAEVTAIAVTDVRRLRNMGSVALGAGSLVKELVDERVENSEASVKQSLDILSRRLEEAKIPLRIIKASGDPYDALTNASRYHDLMLFGLRGLFEHGVIDEPPDELIRVVESGARPILAVGPAYREVHRVLLAYSGSVESAKTIRNFAHHNLWPAAELKVVHFGKPGQEGPALLAEIRDYLHAHGFSVEIEFVEGAPNAHLLEHADQWNADLIVVGNSSKSLLRRRVFGETALHTIRESKLPLFLSQ